MNVPMSNLLPMAFSELPFSEKLLLWGMRVWLRAYHRNENPHHFLRNGFKLAGASSVYPALDHIMSVLTGTDNDRHLVDFIHRSDVAVSEQRLLGAVAALQYETNLEKVDMFLGFWLPLSTIHLLRRPIMQLAESLKTCGLYVRPRNIAARTPVNPGTALMPAAAPKAFH